MSPRPRASTKHAAIPVSFRKLARTAVCAICALGFAEPAPREPLHLDDPADQQAFRRWFTFLAEAQFYRQPNLPREINDCAALIRFAYREALRKHDARWANDLNLPLLPALPPVRQFTYPYTPLAANLFRIGPRQFGQFADAETLQRFNTHFISRDVRDAQPADLLFFRQLSDHMPYHAMIVLGPSHFESGRDRYLLYHTGPDGQSKGEIRRVRFEDLQRHPSPRWRPLPGNGNFLGAYRWDILR